ncbi:phosphohydrolase [Sinorhizobium phage phiN3]|uniref:Phosphohydrolase n=1 Tax=Sinorhizobium phage phiN3 TaxID=1647405 RepID=A0A0F6WCU6_9CAUD|nr:nudix hydrolase [Sinorhizobium phage phiN3]AKF13514.1 phosphohydrolase [Sinorhizobium phage phiN3]
MFDHYTLTFVFNENKQVLLVKSGKFQNYYNGVGGIVGKNENVQTSVLKALKDEAGIIPKLELGFSDFRLFGDILGPKYNVRCFLLNLKEGNHEIVTPKNPGRSLLWSGIDSFPAMAPHAQALVLLAANNITNVRIEDYPPRERK